MARLGNWVRPNQFTIDAVMDENSMFHAGWMAVMGDNMTYNWHSVLLGNYATNLLNNSFGFLTYIRHSSSKSLFENLEDDEVTLGVACSDMREHQKETLPMTHSFRKILDLAYFDQATMTEEIAAPGCNVTMKTMKALYELIYHLCETAKNVEIKWFALTDNYHIVKPSVSVLMEDDDLPVLPCVLRNSKYYSTARSAPIAWLLWSGLRCFSALTSDITRMSPRCWRRMVLSAERIVRYILQK